MPAERGRRPRPGDSPAAVHSIARRDLGSRPWNYPRRPRLAEVVVDGRDRRMIRSASRGRARTSSQQRAARVGIRWVWPVASPPVQHEREARRTDSKAPCAGEPIWRLRARSTPAGVSTSRLRPRNMACRPIISAGYHRIQKVRLDGATGGPHVWLREGAFEEPSRKVRSGWSSPWKSGAPRNRSASSRVLHSAGHASCRPGG